jgi:glucose/arabinose dehydrogenase
MEINPIYKRHVFILAFALFAILNAGLAALAASSAPGPERVKVAVPEKFRSGVFKEPRTLTVPGGFKISVFASGLGRARFMAVGSDGFIYLSVPPEGKVLVLPDRDRDGVADEIKTFARGLGSPHGLAFRGGDLIVAGTGTLVLLRDEDGNLKADSKKTLTSDIPAGGGHWTRTVAIGPDQNLYVSAGSSCNVCVEDDPRRAAVLKFPPEGGKGELFATGLRNSVGIAFHPESKELWGVDNGRDWLGDDLPPEELNNIKEGQDYGWPHCYGDRVPDPEYGTPEKCAKTTAPEVRMQAHSAPLGIAFGMGGEGGEGGGGLYEFPEKYQDVLFIAFHGSWNRSVPTGYKLVYVPFKKGRPSGGPEDFITGWQSGKEVWGRPVMPVIGGDGALYLSDDKAGAIYRITWEGK